MLKEAGATFVINWSNSSHWLPTTEIHTSYHSFLRYLQTIQVWQQRDYFSIHASEHAQTCDHESCEIC